MANQHLEGEARDRFVLHLRRKMDEYGITLEDLAAAINTAAPQYADAKGNVWNGKGEQPEWLKAATNAGANPNFFLIETNSARERSDEVSLSSPFFRR